MKYYKYCPYDGLLLDPSDLSAARRPRCAQCGFVDFQNPRPCVAILIFKGCHVLLARRAIEPAKGLWDIPGGFIDHGESAEEAVVREALEETSLHVRVVRFLGSLPDEYGERGWPTLNLCYLVETMSGEPKAQSDVAALHWVDVADLPGEMAFKHQKKIVQWAKMSIQA